MTKVYSVQSTKPSFRAKRQQALLRDLPGYVSSGSPKLYKQNPDCKALYELLDNAELTSRLQILCPSKIAVVPKALIPASLAAKFLLFQATHSPVLILKGPDLSQPDKGYYTTKEPKPSFRGQQIPIIPKAAGNGSFFKAVRERIKPAGHLPEVQYTRLT